MNFTKLVITAEEKEILRGKLLETEEVTPFKEDIKFFSMLAALGIQQEVGTIHDEFASFLFDARTGTLIPRESLRAELIQASDYIGVRIWAEGHDRLDPRVRGMRTLMHPKLSFDRDGNIHQMVFFPEIITQIAAMGGAELVAVKPWALNTIFGGFDPSKTYYEGNMWEFINIDAVRYSRLLEKRQIVFWGTHDLVSHVAGVKESAWPELAALGKEARILFEQYFEDAKNPAPYSLILPYALGMLLDDLAQPMNYESQNRRIVVELLMNEIRKSHINPNFKPYLLKYPPSIERLFALARSNDVDETEKNAKQILKEVIHDIQRFSIIVA